MTEREKNIEQVLLLAFAKLFSEQSTHLIGELRQERKYYFNQAVQAVDAFIREVEGPLDPYDKETMALLTDALHDGVKGLRRDLMGMEPGGAQSAS